MTKRFLAFFTGLHFRFLLLAFGIVLAMMSAQLLTDSVDETRKLREQRVSDALTTGQMLARTLESRFETMSPQNVDGILDRINNRPEILEISVVDYQLETFADGQPHSGSVDLDSLSDVQLNALRTGKTEYAVYGRMIEVGEPMIADGRIIGSVRVVFDHPGMSNTIGAVLSSNMTTSIPILITGMLFAAGLASQVTVPLRRLSDTADAVSDGDMDRELEIEGAQEVREASHSFNGMISSLKGNMEQIYKLAYVDRVTRLPNREYFYKELSRAIARADRGNYSGALLFLDLDGFKQVNDNLGHDVGDALLAGFADRIAKVVRAGDTVSWISAGGDDHEQWEEEDDDENRQVFSRLGGDEFTVILSEIREETDAAQAARRIISAMDEPFTIGSHEIRLGVSIGIATFTRDGSECDSIIKSADMAMYLAKEEGKNTFRFYSEELNQRASKRIEMEKDLRRAISEDELELHFQPKIDLRTGNAFGLEALLRWNHPEKGTIFPGQFIKSTEETELEEPLGQWVLENACKQIRELEKKGHELSVSINVAPRQFEKKEFAQRVMECVRESKIEARHLELEITESIVTKYPQRALDHIRRLKRSGIRIAIDDFGTGHSNLSQLSRIPFDGFKIDRSFVSGITDEEDTEARSIVRTILAMAESLGYNVVAEGVETGEQRDFLAENGCTHAQGYLFGRPMPVKQLYAWLVDRKRDAAETKTQNVRAA